MVVGLTAVARQLTLFQERIGQMCGWRLVRADIHLPARPPLPVIEVIISSSDDDSFASIERWGNLGHLLQRLF